MGSIRVWGSCCPAFAAPRPPLKWYIHVLTGRCGSGSVRMWVDACYVAVIVTVTFHLMKEVWESTRRVKAQEACATFFLLQVIRARP